MHILYNRIFVEVAGNRRSSKLSDYRLKLKIHAVNRR